MTDHRSTGEQRDPATGKCLIPRDETAPDVSMAVLKTVNGATRIRRRIVDDLATIEQGRTPLEIKAPAAELVENRRPHAVIRHDATAKRRACVSAVDTASAVGTLRTAYGRQTVADREPIHNRPARLTVMEEEPASHLLGIHHRRKHDIAIGRVDTSKRNGPSAEIEIAVPIAAVDSRCDNNGLTGNRGIDRGLNRAKRIVFRPGARRLTIDGIHVKRDSTIFTFIWNRVPVEIVAHPKCRLTRVPKTVSVAIDGRILTFVRHAVQVAVLAESVGNIADIGAEIRVTIRFTIVRNAVSVAVVAGENLALVRRAVAVAVGAAAIRQSIQVTIADQSVRDLATVHQSVAVAIEFTHVQQPVARAIQLGVRENLILIEQAVAVAVLARTRGNTKRIRLWPRGYRETEYLNEPETRRRSVHHDLLHVVEMVGPRANGRQTRIVRIERPRVVPGARRIVHPKVQVVYQRIGHVGCSGDIVPGQRHFQAGVLRIDGHEQRSTLALTEFIFKELPGA